MARLWTCGFELQSVAASVEVLSVTGTPTISTTVHRAGAASLRINPAAATQYVEQQIDTGVVKRTLHRFYLRITSLPSATVPVYAVGQSGYFPAQIRLTTTGALRLYDAFSGTDLGTASAALTVGQWYRIELDHTDAAGTAGSVTGAFVGYIDGVNFSGSTLVSNINGFSRIRAGFLAAATGEIHIDDIAVNDTTGTAQTGLPGPGNVVHLRPDSAGDNNGFATVVGGTAGTANNWARVSETTPDDATTYNATTATGTTLIDDFNLSSTAAAGISGQRVTLVAVGARIGSTATTAASIVYRIKSQAAGTVAESASVSVALNGWATHKAAAPYVHQLTSYTDPQSGGAWTTARLDTAQIGYRANVSQTTARRVSTLWALVETVPVATAALGTAAMTVSGQAPGRLKTQTLGVATVTSSAQTLAPLTGVPIGSLGPAAQSTAAQPLAAGKTAALTPAGEPSAGRALTGRKSTALSPAGEASAAQALGRARARALMQAQETDAGQTPGRGKRKTLPLSTETSAGQPLGRVKWLALGAAAETAVVQVAGRRKTRPLAAAVGTDTAQPPAIRKWAALAAAVESAAGLPLAGRKRMPVLPTQETGAALPLTPAFANTVGAAGETSLARSVGQAKTTAVSAAGEVGTARPVGQVKRTTLGAAVETSEGRLLGGGRSRALAGAGETWTARLPGQAKARPLPTATETVTALPFTAVAAGALTPAVQTTTAQPATGSRTRALTAAMEAGAAQPLTGRKTLPLATATETTAGHPLAGAKQSPLGQAGENDAGQRLLIPGTASTADETSTARPFHAQKRTVLATASTVGQALAFGTAARQLLGHATETEHALPAGHRKASPITWTGHADAARPLAGGKARALGLAAETSRALIGPAIRLTQATDRSTALALVGQRQRPADHLDASASGPDLTPAAAGPVLSPSTTRPALTAAASGPRLTATTN